MSTQNVILNQLRQCIGSDTQYYTPLFKTIKYTEGVKLMSEICQAGWLLTDVLANCTLLSKKEDFLCINVWHDENTGNCSIDFTDGNYNVLKSVEYSFTDFPLFNTVDTTCEKSKNVPALKMFCSSNVLLLTSEY